MASRTAVWTGPRRILLTATVAALAIGLVAEPAMAASTWTIRPGGSVTYSASKPTLKDTRTGAAFTCASVGLTGSLKAGSGLKGTDAGSITGGKWTGCTAPGGPSWTITLGDLPWRFNLTSYQSGVSHGTISHMEISVSGNGCSFVGDGTRSGASDGKLDFIYHNATHALTTRGGNLHIYNVSSDCLGLVSSGDPAKITVTLKIIPKQSITSP